MAWTSPRTWIPGETVTATMLNAHVRDNLNVLAGFTRGGTLVNPNGLTAAITIITWYATNTGTVTNVRGYRVGGTGATINARVSKAQAAASQAWRVTAGSSTYVDETADLASAGANDVQPLPTSEAVNDYFAVGYTTKFNALRLNVGTVGTGTATVAWEYWNGSTWAAISGVTDGTGALKNAGQNTVAFDPPSDWAASIINGSASLYYVRMRLASNSYTVDPLITQGWVVPCAGNLLASALSLATADEWTDGGTVQNTAVAAGDRLEIMVVSVTGSPTQVAVAVDMVCA